MSDMTDVITRITSLLIRFGGPIATLYVMWAGYKWMTARGNPAAQEAAQTTLVQALVGLAIVVSPFLLVNTFTNILGTGEGGVAQVEQLAAIDSSQLEAPGVVELRKQEGWDCSDNSDACTYEVDFSEPIICTGSLHLRATNVTSNGSAGCNGSPKRTLSFTFAIDENNPAPDGFIERFAMSGSTRVVDADDNGAILAFERMKVE